MKKKFIAYGLLLVSCLCLLVVGIVTVLATTQREVDAGLFVRFTAEDVDGSVTMYYRIGGSGDWIKNGETIVFNAEDNDNQAKTTDLTLDSEVTKSSKYVEFKYEFVNTGSKYYTATMMLETTERENISLTYKYNDPTETKEYDDLKYAVVVPGETDASNAKTYFIKVGMEDLSRSANFSGTFNWILKGYNLVNNEELVLTTLDYVETATAGTYSAKYNGSPLEDNTLVIPSKLGDSPVTTVGKCEGTLPANTKVVVREGVTSIGENAFKNQKGLKELELPTSLSSIDVAAFAGCTNLKSLTFPEDSQLKEIKNQAFMSAGLEEIFLPDGLESIGKESLYNTGLEAITIPASVTNIVSAAFPYNSLTTIIVDDANTCFEMRGNCLIEKSTGRLIKGFNDSIIPDDGTIKIIDDRAFMFQDNFKCSSIPEGITEIRGSAFAYVDFTSIILPSTLIKLDSEAFSFTFLTEITIPENVTTLGAGVFRNTPLEKIEVSANNENYYSKNNCIIQRSNKALIQGCANSVIPTDGSVEILDKFCFAGVNIKSLSIPASIKEIKEVITFYCGELETITVDEKNTTYHSSGNCVINTANKEVVLGCKNSIIPDDGSVTSIGVRAFYYISSLKTIIIPSSVKTIKNQAFRGTSLTSVTFESTSGWYVTTSLSATSGTNLSSTDLSNTTTAATYLKSTYTTNYWKCN